MALSDETSTNYNELQFIPELLDDQSKNNFCKNPATYGGTPGFQFNVDQTGFFILPSVYRLFISECNAEVTSAENAPSLSLFYTLLPTWTMTYVRLAMCDHNSPHIDKDVHVLLDNWAEGVQSTKTQSISAKPLIISCLQPPRICCIGHIGTTAEEESRESILNHHEWQFYKADTHPTSI